MFEKYNYSSMCFNCLKGPIWLTGIWMGPIYFLFILGMFLPYGLLLLLRRVSEESMLLSSADGLMRRIHSSACATYGIFPTAGGWGSEVCGL